MITFLNYFQGDLRNAENVRVSTEIYSDVKLQWYNTTQTNGIDKRQPALYKQRLVY